MKLSDIGGPRTLKLPEDKIGIVIIVDSQKQLNKLVTYLECKGWRLATYLPEEVKTNYVCLVNSNGRIVLDQGYSDDLYKLVEIEDLDDQKVQVTIEFECNEKTCGKCKYQFSDYCPLFIDKHGCFINLKENEKGDRLRCAQCLVLAKKQEE